MKHVRFIVKLSAVCSVNVICIEVRGKLDSKLGCLKLLPKVIMDLLVLITVAVALIVVILTILYLQKNKGDEKKGNRNKLLSTGLENFQINSCFTI